MKIFVDASLVIDLLEGTGRGTRFAASLVSVPSEWCVSPLVRLECRVKALARNDRQRLSDVEMILASMTSLPLIDDVFERGAVIRATTGLNTPDALHVATALVHGCGELWKADARMARVAAEGLAVRLVE